MICLVMQKFNPKHRKFNPNFKNKRFDRNKPRELTFDQMLRRFKKKVERSGLLKELRKREYYEKPTAKRRRKQKEGEARWKKQVRMDRLSFEAGRERMRRRSL